MAISRSQPVRFSTKAFTLQFPPCAECAVCPGAPAAEDLMNREPGLFRVSLMSNQDILAISDVSVSGSS